MSSNLPTVRQTNWVSIIPHLFIMGLMIFFWYQINERKAFLYGAMTYLMTSYLLRSFIPKDHRNGIKKNHSGDFKGAILDFQKSYDFFSRYDWVDKYRFITLLSSSKMSYKEMALTNIGFCYSQIGEGENARQYYERTLKEFPQNGIAISALKMMDSVKNNI